MDKNTAKRLLAESDYAPFEEAARRDFALVSRRLMAYTYDKTQEIGWRAIRALGAICGAVVSQDPAVVRTLAQRLLWMMRDESGNNPGSAPEILGEMVRACPDALNDIAPIIASFEDEEMLRPGVVWALYRIAEVRPDLVSQPAEFFERLLGDRNAVVRANAVLAVSALGMRELANLSAVQNDHSAVMVYFKGTLQETTVAALAHGEIGKG